MSRARAVPKGMKAGAASGVRPRILVVDDEPENLAVLTRILRRSYTVDAAGSGREAIKKLKAGTYDIILSDQRMPGMTGSVFLSKSVKLAPDAIRIVVSAYSDFDAILEALNVAGASAFLQKPIAAEQLEGAIARAVQARSESISRSNVVIELKRDLEDAQTTIRDLEAKLSKD